MIEERRKSYNALVRENAELRARLDEAHDALQAIRTGGVDGLVIEGPKGDRIYTLEGADHPYRIFVESMNEGAVTIDMQGTVVYANQAFADLIGQALEKTVGTRLSHWVQASDRLHFDGLLNESRRRNSRRELSLLNSKGESVPVHLSSRHMPVLSGDFYCLVVTDLRAQRVQEQLRHSEERLRLALDGADMGSWDVDLITGQATWNRRHAALQGYSEEGPHSIEQWRDRLHPDDLDRVLAVAEKAKRERASFAVEHRLRLPESDEIRWLSLYGRFTYNEAGEAVRFSGISLDITDRKQAEIELTRSEQHLRRLLEAMHVFVGVLTPDGVMVECNTAPIEAAGLRREDVIGTHFADSFWWNYSEASNRRIRSDIDRAAGGEKVRYDAPVRVKNAAGEIEFIDVDFALTPLFDEAGTVTHLIPIGINVSERTRAESALRESEGRLRELATHLEHRVEERTVELRQSHERLRALANELNLAEQRERKRLAGDLHDYLAQLLVVLRMKLRQAAQLVTDNKAETMLKEADHVLTQSLNYTRSLVAELTPPALHEFGLTQALAWLASQMQQHGLQVLITHQQEALEIPEDQAVLLFQSVRELLFNVLKHANAKQATVSLSVTPTHELHLSVTDDGCGFDPETLSKRQTDPKRFGLFSLRERLAAMGGRFEIQSSIGQGTRALLVTPYWPAPSKVSSDQKQEANGKPRVAECLILNDECSMTETEKRVSDTGKPDTTAHSTFQQHTNRVRVLLVDDHAMVRQGIRNVLEQYDDVTVVGEAGNGAEAVQLVETLRPTVVVMDVNMPEMNGIDATAAIKDRHAETVVIGISVQAGGTNERLMKQAGAVTLITKEAAVEELHNAIQDALAASRPPET